MKGQVWTMANNYALIMKGKGLDKIWDGKSFNSILPEPKPFDWEWRQKHWGNDGRIRHFEVDTDYIGILTVWNMPYFVLAKLSTMTEDKKLVTTGYDQDNYGSNSLTIEWENGKMIKAFVARFDWDTEEYMLPEEVGITEQFNCN